MQKSISTRFRITSKGKVIRRKMSLDHFRSRKTSKNIRAKRKTIKADRHKKAILNYAKS